MCVCVCVCVRVRGHAFRRVIQGPQKMFEGSSTTANDDERLAHLIPSLIWGMVCRPPPRGALHAFRRVIPASKRGGRPSSSCEGVMTLFCRS